MISEKIQQAAMQGDSRSIAAWLNHSLNSEGIKVRIRKTNDRLKVLLEYNRPWTSKSMVAYIKKFFIELNIRSIKTIAVYGRPAKAKPPYYVGEWMETIYLEGVWIR